MTERSGGELVYDALLSAGIDLLVGLPGTQTLPLDRVVARREEMRYVMARHETAIPHVAWGHYEAGGGPVATLTVPGPGETNAMHGLKNAAEDNVPLVHVAADIDPDERGKGPIHEIPPDTYDNAVKANVQVETPRELRAAASRAIETALSVPLGPVRLGVPSGFLASDVTAPAAEVTPETVQFDAGPAIESAAALLADARRPVVYAGGGARRSRGGPEVVAALVEALNAPAVTSLKGKGVLDETDSQVMGVTASHLNAGAKRVLDAADAVLALGTDFDGIGTDGWTLPMGETLVHVNVDVREFDAAYDADVAVPGDVAAVGEALLDALDGGGAGGWDGAALGRAVREEYEAHLDELGLLDGGSPANTPAVLRAVRAALPAEAVVTTDIGGFRLWASQVFPAHEATGYVTAGSWAGMGVGLPAALGAKLATPERPVACLHGDGGLLMCLQELHTAAQEDLDVTVVVFNNHDYGTISKSPKIAQYAAGSRFEWDSPDFAAIAEGFGCRGETVETPAATRAAVEDSLDRGGVDVVVVEVATDEPSVNDGADYEPSVDPGDY
jgi:acetolactate synthase-1/2/3 large subunit